jgi:hypothetical protein
MEDSMKRFLVVPVALLIACGGSTATDVNSGVTGAATITLSGAQTGTFSANDVATVWNSAGNQGGFAISTAQSGTTPAITVGISFVGEPHTGHYKNTDAATTGGVSVNPSSLTFWLASNTSGSTPQGSYDLNLTSVSTAGSVSTGKTYTVSGTFDAVLPALAGSNATGTVTMHVTF